jgi:2'-hydroxyisoflavone reductase
VTTRRAFLRISTIILAAATLPAHAGAPAESQPQGKKLHILILGGTGFLGPACMESALAHGHKVTLFNSGRSEERRQANGRPSVVPAGVDVLIGNRDPEKTADDRRLAGLPEDQRKPDPNSPKGLTQLQGKTFDAVIDTSGYYPRMVKASAELLAPNVQQYVFISTLSVYKSNEQPGNNEDAELGTLEDPTVETMGPQGAHYGPLKVLCEKAVEEALPGRATILRPGFIVGPRDNSQRFMYWPVRISQGGEMPVPGTPETLIQTIDVRDLADFTVRCIEEKITGVYNTTGEPMTMKAFVEGIREGVSADTTFTFLGKEFTEQQHLGFGEFPLWIPQEGEGAGFHQRDVSKAVKAGLKFRPIADTAKATLAWFNEVPEAMHKNLLNPGRLTPEREKEILEAFRSGATSTKPAESTTGAAD